MYTGFVDPGVTFEVYFNKVKKYEITGVYNAGLNRITADFTAEQIKEMPLIADVRVRFGADKYPLRVKIKPSSEGSSDGVVGYTIGLSGDSYTVIEILGLSLVEEQVGIATEKANQTAADALQTAADRVQTGQDAATATTKATEAAGSATAAVNAQTAAEAARDEAIQVLAQKMDSYRVNTFADLQTFISNPDVGVCDILVLFDETYGGLPRKHTYTGDVPVLGPKLIQFVTYTE